MRFSDTFQVHWQHGLKTGLAATLAYVITLALGLEFGYWAVLSTVIVMQMNVADSLRMCSYRFFGTALGAVLGVTAILVFPETPSWTAVAVFVTTGLCAYMTRYDVRYRMAAITVCIVVLASLGAPNRVLFGLYRILEIGIGVCCAFVITVAVWPRRAGQDLRQRLATQFALAAREVQLLTHIFITGGPPPNSARITTLESEAAALRELLDKALRHERRLFTEDTARLNRHVVTLSRCAENLRAMHSILRAESGAPPDIMRDELREVAVAAGAVVQAEFAPNQADLRRLEQAIAKAEAQMHLLRDQGATRTYYLQEVLRFFSFYYALLRFGTDVRHAVYELPDSAPK
ncbi:MAG: FUSC family protein [Desulfohalobium sp.]